MKLIFGFEFVLLNFYFHQLFGVEAMTEDLYCVQDIERQQNITQSPTLVTSRHSRTVVGKYNLSL